MIEVDLSPIETALVLPGVLRPGDVLLRKTDEYITSKLIPGFWSHSALYAGAGRVLESGPAVKGGVSGVHAVDLATFCAGGYAVLVLRPRQISAAQVDAALAWAEAQIGKPFDYWFDYDDDSRLACTELVATALAHGTGEDWTEGQRGAVAPDEFLNERFDRVWTNYPGAPTTSSAARGRRLFWLAALAAAWWMLG